MNPIVLAIVNQKGGVGKTTSAINIATFLSESGLKTLLIDLDPQANATSGVGIKTGEIQASVYDFMVSDHLRTDVLYPTPFENLHLMPSSQDLAGAEIELVSVVSREWVLKKRLDVIKSAYDFIIMDCPPSLGLLTVNALVAADKAIIPVQCEYFALEGLARLVQTVSLVKGSYNPQLEVGGIVLTMYDSRTALNKQVAQNAKSYFSELVFDTIIPRNIRLTEAPSHGLPIALYSPLSKGSQAYLDLTKELIQRVAA
ncbi:MAG: ParA family protein [Candidatus Margulisiibacteriota bacterium]